MLKLWDIRKVIENETKEGAMGDAVECDSAVQGELRED